MAVYLTLPLFCGLHTSSHSLLPPSSLSLIISASVLSAVLPASVLSVSLSTVSQFSSGSSSCSGISSSPSSLHTSLASFSLTTPGKDNSAPRTAHLSACSLPSTPACDGTHWIETLSPNNCQLCQSCIHRSRCASAPLDPTHACLSHFAHLPCSPAQTISESVTICNLIPGVFPCTAASTPRSSARPIVCFSWAGTAARTLRGLPAEYHTPYPACDTPAVSVRDPSV
mmetsp:Transcript_25982/g.43331  ORF Transcript_25982/g.43331 Transcript_25982/m.43331 type:complete len:227 (-) Transcript_25982:616-1296(-)